MSNVKDGGNILVAPRYSNLTNYKVASPSLDYERAYIGFSTAIDNATSQSVFVALFKKGNSGWMELVTTDLNRFKSQFGFDPYFVTWSTSGDIWYPLRVMANYNRFCSSVLRHSKHWQVDE